VIGTRGTAAALPPARPADPLLPLGTTPPLLTWSCFDPSRVRVALTTRSGGVSTGRYASLNLGLHVGDSPGAVLENRTRVAGALRASLDELVFCQQVHRRAVTVVGAEHRGRGARSDADAIPETDALVTTDPGIALVVMVADCVPIVLHEPVAGVLAVVHAGWGGTVRGVTPAAVQTMLEHGSDPARIVAGIGPAIDGAIYQVGDDVADLARAAFDDAVGEVLRPDGSGRYLFDLVAGARIQLQGTGLSPTNIHASGLVTGPGTPFFSHRLEGPCGRFAVLARLLAGGVT